MTSHAQNRPDAVDARSRGFERDLVALIPNLRAFSRSLCGRRAIGEDMVQEALARAWRARDRFEPGTNLKAWVFTILRNQFYSHTRTAWREMHWNTELGDNIRAPAREQESALELADAVHALNQLPDTQREALVLIAAGGFTYFDAAKICGTPLGTVKSRVARGRDALLGILDGGAPLTRTSGLRAEDATDNILAQLSVLTQPGATRAGIHA